MYTTGQIAAKFGVSIKTIQRLDSDGILIPKRNQFNNRRIYDHNDIAKLTDILMQSKAGRKLGSDGARSNEAYTPTDALIEAIMSTCKAIRPELAQEFKEIIPSLGLDLSAIAEAGEYINKVFAQSVFAKAFLTTEEIEYIKFRVVTLEIKLKEATPMIEEFEPAVEVSADPEPQIPGLGNISMNIEVQGDRKELDALNTSNINAIIEKELSGVTPVASRFGVG